MTAPFESTKFSKKKLYFLRSLTFFNSLFNLCCAQKSNQFANQIFRSILLEFLNFTIYNVMHNHYSFLLDVSEGSCGAFNSTKNMFFFGFFLMLGQKLGKCFVVFFGKLKTPQSPSEISWPLLSPAICNYKSLNHSFRPTRLFYLIGLPTLDSEKK